MRHYNTHLPPLRFIFSSFHDSACMDVALTFPRHATLESVVHFSSVSFTVLACSQMGHDFHSFGSGEQDVRRHCNVSVI